MNRTFWKHGLWFVVLLMIAALTGCTKEGPAGASGKDATASALEGFADSIKCGICHNADQDTVYYVNARVLEWENSVHATGGYQIENSSDCSACHTTEGYIQSASGVTVTNHYEATPPGCFACHSPHSRGDFSLRTTAAVTLASNIVGVASSTFDYGKGNLCVSCHHPRTLSPLPDPTKTATTDTIKITSNRWYAHYGVQGQLLMGEGGFEFTDYTYSGNSNHSGNAMIKQEGCTICHMADPTLRSAIVGTAGGHTMTIVAAGGTLYTGCNTTGCHSSLASLDYNGKMTAVKNNMDTLKALLVAKTWIDTSNNILYPRTIVPASLAGTLFNYLLVLHDGSYGIHNSQYTLDLLRSSIYELRK